ncbi:MAG: hypothetical protein PVF83_13925 [Anaerolineales bacterium]|jgi:hypothetical protein
MAKRLTNDEKNLDDQLAQFTDQVISGQATQPSAPDTAGDLLALQKVILEIHRSTSQQAPDGKLTAKLQRNLLKAWRQEMERDASGTNLFSRITRFFSPRSSGWQSTAQRRRRLAGQIALAAIVVLAIFIPLAQSQGPLSGAATGETGIAILFLVLIAAGSLVAWFLWGRK